MRAEGCAARAQPVQIRQQRAELRCIGKPLWRAHLVDDDDEDFEDFDFAQAYGLESFYDPSGSRE